MKRRFALLALVFVPLLASCDPASEPEVKKPAAEAPEASRVRLETSLGNITVELNAEKAPVTVKNFLDYVGKKHFDGTVFHRVMKDFMIQGGGFELKDGKLIEKPTGKGIVNEGRNGLKNDRGTIAMARTPDPDSATAQFYINVVDNEGLNGGYAVFGKVVDGMDVVDKIRAVPTGRLEISMLHPETGEAIASPADDVPKEPVKIISAKVVE